MTGLADRWLVAALLLSAAALSNAAGIATAEPGGVKPSVDAQLLQSKIAEIEASTSLDVETSTTLVELYRRSLSSLQQARLAHAEAETLERAGAAAPEELAKVQRSLEQEGKTDPTARLQLSSNVPLTELDALLTKEKADLAQVEAKLGAINERYAFAVTRPAAARARLIEARQEQEATAAELEAPVTDVPAAIAEAQRWRLETRAYRFAAEIHKLDQELLTHQARLALLEVQEPLAVLRVEAARARVRLVEETIGGRRLAEAEQAQRAAEARRDELEDRHPVVRELAIRNYELSDQLAVLAAELETASVEHDAVRKLASRIEDELSSTRSKLAIAGLSQVLGQVLIEQRRSLPEAAALRKQASQREARIVDIGLQQIHLAEERRALRDLERYVDDRLVALVPEKAESLRPELRELATNQRDLVRRVADSGAGLLRTLGDLVFAERRLVDTVQAFDDFLDRRLLWIRNTTPIKLDVVKSLPSDVIRILAPASWTQLGSDLLVALGGAPLVAALLAALLLLGMLRRRFLAAVQVSGEPVGRVRADRFSYSLTALAATVFAAAPLPVLIMTIGGLITANAESAEFSHAVAENLVKVGFDLLILQFFADACSENGLAARHFRWPTTAVSKLRSELNWFRIVLPVTRFIGETSYQLDAGGFVGGLAVLGSLGSAAALSVFIVRIFLPQGGVLNEFLTRHPKGLLARLRVIWFGALVSVLPVLIILWLVGYNYTAEILAVSYMYSVWLVVATVMLQGLLVRWLTLVYRKLRLQAATERLEATRLARATDEVEEYASAADESVGIEQPEVDVAALDSDSRRFLNAITLFAGVAGLWVIWSPIVPALGILDDIALWSHAAIVNGETLQVPVTLGDLLLALIVAVTTGVAARGLPSFVEFMLLQATTITTGGRYTATTLLRYAIIGIGTVAVFGMLGASWSQIQWLVAALGVGIGFGLQEIVANFISGLIILFERPIRVGDVVTVGDTSGVVTRIKIRATTITDWDRKELLVPNREFVTNRLLNWTLSDPINRVVIAIGIAYGSDVTKAMMLVEEAAREHHNVLEDPAPFVTFEEFGDDALKLSLRAYLPSMDQRIGTISDLHAAINGKLVDAGIVIAFPQRDVHLDTTQPLEIRVQPAEKGV